MHTKCSKCAQSVPNHTKCTKLTQNVPNAHKVYQMHTKCTKSHKMYQINTKCTKWSKNIPNVCKLFQMSIKYINIFQSKALQNLPKLEFFGLKRNHLATLPWTAAYENLAPIKLGFCAKLGVAINPSKSWLQSLPSSRTGFCAIFWLTSPRFF
jgi:hypothetical protein